MRRVYELVTPHPLFFASDRFQESVAGPVSSLESVGLKLIDPKGVG